MCFNSVDGLAFEFSTHPCQSYKPKTREKHRGGFGDCCQKTMACIIGINVISHDITEVVNPGDVSTVDASWGINQSEIAPWSKKPW